MVAVPRTVMDDGFTAMLKLAGRGAVIVTVAEPFSIAGPGTVAVADTVTEVGETPEVRTTCATPLALVTLVRDPRVAAELLRLKVTVTPDNG